MPEQTSYEVSDEELLKSLVQAAADAGAANSGLVIDIGAGWKLRYMHYLMGCMRARLDGKKPEIQPRTTVRVEVGKVISGCDLRGIGYGVPDLQAGEYKVYRVWYFKNTWYLELVGKEGREGGLALYSADRFLASAVVA